MYFQIALDSTKTEEFNVAEQTAEGDFVIVISSNPDRIEEKHPPHHITILKKLKELP